MGEVSERPGPTAVSTQPRVEGLAVDLAARIAGLASPAQVLISAAVANSARQRVDDGLFRHPGSLGSPWERYLLKGFDEPVEIREAGFEGFASFRAPIASEKAAPLVEQSSPVVESSQSPSGGVVIRYRWGFACIPCQRRACCASGTGTKCSRGATNRQRIWRNVPNFGGRPAIAVYCLSTTCHQIPSRRSLLMVLPKI